MFLFKAPQRADGRAIAVFLADHQRTELSRTCFRGMQGPLAGSFARYRNITELFHNPHVKAPFCDHIADVFRADDGRLIRTNHAYHETFQIDVGRPVGWSAYIPLSDCHATDLERRMLREQPAMWIRRDSHILAPTTKLVSFLCKFQAEYTPNHGLEWKVVIYRLAVGNQIADLRGAFPNLSEIALFHWSHQGQPISR